MNTADRTATKEQALEATGEAGFSDALLDWYDQGRLKPHVSNVLPLSEVEDGMELLRQRKSTGKVVIRMR